MPDTTYPSKPASESKRVKLTYAGGIGILVALLSFLVGLTHIPFIGNTKWVTIIAGVAALLLTFVGSLRGILDSGTKIEFGGDK